MDDMCEFAPDEWCRVRAFTFDSYLPEACDVFDPSFGEYE